MSLFDEEYFYGKKKSNYSDYERMDRSKFDEAVAFIEREDVSGRFLEVGCAFGFFLERVAPFFDDVHGCDISPFAIEKARERNPGADLRVLDIERPLPYRDGSFDCVAALDVLEHTASFDQNFRKLASKLRAGGYFLLTLPIDAWPRRLFAFLDRDETHVSIPTEGRLRRLIGENDLTIRTKKKYAPAPLIRKVPRVPAQMELFLQKN